MKLDRGLTIERMLKLGRVSRSGFYRYRDRGVPASDRHHSVRQHQACPPVRIVIAETHNRRPLLNLHQPVRLVERVLDSRLSG